MTADLEWEGKGWAVSIDDSELVVSDAVRTTTITSAEAACVEPRRRWFRWTLENEGRPVVKLRGIGRTNAQAMALEVRRLALRPAIVDAVAWHAAATQLITTGLADLRWIPSEAVDKLLAERPEPRLVDRVAAAGIAETLADTERVAVDYLDDDLAGLVETANEQIMAAELVSCRPFFDTIETTPLTEEQARAVVCFDSRVQVLAAAGSGKTSVMVARAAYAVSRGFVSADRILLLAFNKAAAAELQERVAARFAAAGIDASGLRASTFHSYGLDVIGAATHEKPRLAKWLDRPGGDTEMVVRIVDELRDASETFRYSWDLYRLLFANMPTDINQGTPDDYDMAASKTGYRTFAGDVVKSHGERLIADFLFLNGVTYEYERTYSFNTASATHSQYRPDFYYPDVDAWHEHWALDRNGDPPAAFVGYADGMAWKRASHKANGTTFVETTWADVVFGNGLEELRGDLSALGLAFDWNPDRPIANQWAKPMKHEDLARLVRTFMAHVKSNSWTREDLEVRLMTDLPHLAGYRTRLFLDVYWKIHDEWEKRLAAERSVDFEDMLVRAANHLESADVDGEYDLIMVDEFQDASQARARLVRGLVRTPGRFLLAVGDDWQSINRFAGADLSVMTAFESWFGRGPQLALTKTFRCPQTICDVASTFVSKNPNQFTKTMTSVQAEAGPPITVIRSDDTAGAVAAYLTQLSIKVDKGLVSSSRGLVTVDVLGRYGFERQVVPASTPKNLRVMFRTVHGAKGLEADYIVIPGMTTGTYGFPSTIADDPVLDLAMPSPESYEHAEERRLLYVALTRARREVLLITPTHQMSPFVVELLTHPGVTSVGANGKPVRVCTRCGKGALVDRTGPYGPFVGCSTFPACKGPPKSRRS